VRSQNDHRRDSGVKMMWPYAGFVGVWCAIWSGDYVKHRELGWMRWKTGKEE